MANKHIIFGERITNNMILSLIRTTSFVFQLKTKKASGYIIDLRGVHEISMLGVLILCKFLEYSISQKCFTSPILGMSDNVKRAITRYGCLTLVESFMKDKKANRKAFENLKTQIEENFIIAPRALLRNDNYSRESINSDYLPLINRYYKENTKTADMIMQIFSELLLNFWEHAVDDSQSIIMAYGTNEYIEIACIDTGNGIKSTLIETIPLKRNETARILLEKAVKKGITSKENTDHMGYGLWILNEIASKTKGKLYLISEGSAYINEPKKKYTTDCDYWGGTIIYVSLPLRCPVTIADLDDKTNHNIKINFV